LIRICHPEAKPKDLLFFVRHPGESRDPFCPCADRRKSTIKGNMDSSFRWNDNKGWVPALNSLRLLEATRDDGIKPG
jgi:hypothetical protein